MWTRFMDMHSGGGQKLDWARIYIEADRATAERIFAARFGRRPDHVTCGCCGDDYSFDDGPDLAQVSGYDRGCRSLKGRRDADGKYIKPPKNYYEDDEEAPEGWEFDRRFSDRYVPLAEYIKSPGVKIIPASEIAPHELAAELPPQKGWVFIE